jgi:simple sugar transport system substrate-binding protein
MGRLAAVVVALAGCTNGGGDGAANPTQADAPRTTVALVTHQAPGDTFWDLVRRGAESAAAKDDVDLRYLHDPDAAGQADLIRSAVADQVAGIAVTLAAPVVMAPAIKEANAAGIPVVALNAGIADWKAMGVLEFFGQDEMIAGVAVGERFSNEGAQNVLCVIHEPGHVGLEARCDGVAAGFTGKTQRLYVDGGDKSTVKPAVIAKLQQDFGIDRVLTLGAPMAMAALEAVAEANSYARIDTFDTNSAVVDAIKNGMIDWAIDQQPFLQGYLAVDSLWLYVTNGNVIGGGVPTLTGPSFVDETNIATVSDLAERGTR